MATDKRTMRFSIEDIEKLNNMTTEHTGIQKDIRRACKTTRHSVIKNYIAKYMPLLEDKANTDLCLVANMSFASTKPELYDDIKNVIWKTMGMCVGKTL